MRIHSVASPVVLLCPAPALAQQQPARTHSPLTHFAGRAMSRDTGAATPTGQKRHVSNN